MGPEDADSVDLVLQEARSCAPPRSGLLRQEVPFSGPRRAGQQRAVSNRSEEDARQGFNQPGRPSSLHFDRVGGS
eukprot:1571254-Rhodomonas_salina.1